MEYPIRVTDQLGQHIKSLRKARGLSQTDLGRRIGVGQARVAEIEAAPGLVNLEQLLKIFRALDSELLLHSDSTSAHSEKALGLSPDEQRTTAAQAAGSTPVKPALSHQAVRKAASALGIPTSSSDALYSEIMRMLSSGQSSVLHRHPNEGAW
jgi:HTH-type transcriptional regulator/antitoxin HipB